MPWKTLNDWHIKTLSHKVLSSQLSLSIVLLWRRRFESRLIFDVTGIRTTGATSGYWLLVGDQVTASQQQDAITELAPGKREWGVWCDERYMIILKLQMATYLYYGQQTKYYLKHKTSWHQSCRKIVGNFGEKIRPSRKHDLTTN